jgi:hypothetical protein
MLPNLKFAYVKSPWVLYNRFYKNYPEFALPRLTTTEDINPPTVVFINEGYCGMLNNPEFNAHTEIL